MSAADLSIQPRINSESLSQAFEQSLVAENDFSMVAAPPEVSMPVVSKRRPAVVSELVFEHTDPDDEADSWLIPSPGPPSGHKFEMSPPKEGQSAKTGSYLRKTQIARENSSQEANGGAAVRRAPGPPAQRASKIPRVASLGGTRSTSKSALQEPAKAPAPALTPGNPKLSSNNKFIGLRKKPETAANGSSPAATDPSTGKAATAKVPTAKQSKALVNGERAINAKREDDASSRIPSRPGTASATRPAAGPSPTKATTAVSKQTAAASKSGPAGGKPSTAASRPTVAAAAKRAAAPQAGARRVSKIGGRTTDAGSVPVPLLSAVSGPEEELATAAQAEEEESQPAAPREEAAQPVPTPPREDRPNGTAIVDPLPPLQTEPPAKQEAPLSKTKSAGSNGARISRQTTPRPDWVDVMPPPPTQEPQEECAAPTDKAADAAPAEPGLHVSDSSVSKKSLHKMPSTPFANQQAVTDDKQQEESRPGVGRKKAADLPDAGYSKPTHQQKGCCGCVVM